MACAFLDPQKCSLVIPEVPPRLLPARSLQPRIPLSTCTRWFDMPPHKSKPQHFRVIPPTQPLRIIRVHGSARELDRRPCSSLEKKLAELPWALGALKPKVQGKTKATAHDGERLEALSKTAACCKALLKSVGPQLHGSYLKKMEHQVKLIQQRPCTPRDKPV